MVTGVQRLQQTELFPAQKGPEVPGFMLVRNYITTAEECELLAKVESGPWETDYRRRIQQYGVGYSAERGRRWRKGSR